MSPGIFYVYFVTGTVTKKVGKDVVDWEFVFVYFIVLFVFIVYGGCFMMRNAVMRVRSGNYRAARYLNSFANIPVALASVLLVLLIGELVLRNPAVCDSFMLAVHCAVVGFIVAILAGLLSVINRLRLTGCL